MSATSQALLERLLASTHEVAAMDRPRVRVAPFTAYLDPLRAAKWFSFALADVGADPGAAEAALPALRDAFAAQGRVGRVELLDELTPALPRVLERSGWELSERMPVMVCTRGSLIAPADPEGLSVEAIGPETPDDVLRECQTVQRAAFEENEPVTDAQVERMRERARDSFFTAGRLGGEIVGTAAATPVVRGVVEVVGVATLAAARGRGVAAALTTAVVEAAYAGGAELAWLTAADAGAERLYGRIGFGLAGTQSAYDAPAG